MALMLLSNGLLRRQMLRLPFGARSAHRSYEDELFALIGKREIVGYGFNGEPNYADRADFPFPAIRWKETNAELCALREKEKGDWKGLSVEEKKQLYRSSYRQTFAEFKAPTGEWKQVVSAALVVSTLMFWLYFFFKIYVHNPRPKSFNPESQAAQLRRILDLKVNPVTGISSKWDYDEQKWK